MKIGIIGAGAMGSLLAFYLSARAEVWLLSRQQAQVEAIAAHGLRCERDGVENAASQFRATEDHQRDRRGQAKLRRGHQITSAKFCSTR